jgi:hypothetical protein
MRRPPREIGGQRERFTAERTRGRGVVALPELPEGSYSEHGERMRLLSSSRRNPDRATPGSRQVNETLSRPLCGGWVTALGSRLPAYGSRLSVMSFQFRIALNTRLNSPWFCQR